jgi:hypothetical protein
VATAVKPEGKPDSQDGSVPATNEEQERAELVARLEKAEKEATELREQLEHEDEEENVLDLTSLAPNRRLVKLATTEHPDGERFQIRMLDDFGIGTQQQLLAHSRKLEALFNAEEELKQDQRDRMKFLLDELFNRLLVPPSDMTEDRFIEVKKSMSDAVRNRVVSAFSLVPRLELLAMQEIVAKRVQAEEERRTGRSTSES